MRRGTAATGLCSLVLAALGSAPASAIDGVAPVYDWSGLYAGAHLGGALALTDVNDPFGGSIYGDTIRAPGPIAGGQIGYNWQFGRGVVGLEAEAAWADLDATYTCFAYSGFFISANCRSRIDAQGTLAARFGWLVGADAGTLLYGKAGAAWRQASLDATTNAGVATPSTSVDGFRWGWMLGAGAERAISTRWSLKAEYDFLDFGSEGLSTPVGLFQPVASSDPSAVTAVGSTATDASQSAHLFKIGLNYRLGGEKPIGVISPSPQPVSGNALETGARYVYGWGRFQKDLANGLDVSTLNSRLSYSDMITSAAEAFARLDLASGLMVKGFVGKGSDTGAGKLNDEDWGVPFAIFVPYSNTWSEVHDDIRYGVIDVGYDVWRDARFRFAPFIGYGMFRQAMQAFGCVQLANPNSDCERRLSTATEGISETDTWRAMRLGAAADLQLLPGLRLTADAAYLPYLHFDGIDDHVLRDLVSAESANGTGAQLDLIVSYALTERLRLGVGARYWTMWTPDGVVDFGGQQIVPMRYSSEQAALLVQGSYTFGDAGQ